MVLDAIACLPLLTGSLMLRNALRPGDPNATCKLFSAHETKTLRHSMEQMAARRSRKGIHVLTTYAQVIHVSVKFTRK